MDNAYHALRSGISTDSRLPPQFRLVARIVWIITVGEMLGLTLAGAMPRFNQLVAETRLDYALLAQIGVPSGLPTTIRFGLAILFFLIFCIPAVIIYWRRPDDWTALLASITLFAIGCTSTDFSDALRDLHAQEWPLLAIPVDLIRSASEGLPVVTLVFFPSGRAVPRWLRWGAFLMLLWTLVRPFLYFTPIAFSKWSPAFYAIFLAMTLGGAVAAQVYRFMRVSTPAQRQQTKWIMLGCVVGVVGLVGVKAAVAVFPVLNVPGTLTYAIWDMVDYTVYVLFLIPVPIVFMVSILRYRLWDIDFIINRSLVYGGVTLLLAAVFGVTLFAAQQVIRAVTGREEIPMLGVVASTMIVGVLFQPARVRLRHLVDRYVYGIRIDYRRALDDEAARDVAAHRRSATKTSFGSYTDVQLIGRGGMGEVYRGMHPTLRRSVAIKLLPEAMASDDYARKRFLREAQTIARLRHPNIVSIQDYGEADGIPYMVMDFVDGMSLSEFMRQRGPLPLDEALISLEDIAAALDYAHTEGIVHRDIKPSNVMIQPVTQTQSSASRLYRAVLMDFGIAKIVTDVTSRLTTTGMMGTIDYIAPEQIQGAADVTGLADVYSMGVMAYQMLTGKLPFNHSNPAAMLIAHLMEPVPDPKQARPDVPDRACGAILRAMAKKPEERFATAGAFVSSITA